MKTKVYRVTVNAIDNSRKYSIKTIGIACISDKIASINITDIMKNLGLVHEKIRRGKEPVDLLIRIDYPHLHTGETKQVNHVIACKPPPPLDGYCLVPNPDTLLLKQHKFSSSVRRRQWTLLNSGQLRVWV